MADSIRLKRHGITSVLVPSSTMTKTVMRVAVLLPVVKTWSARKSTRIVKRILEAPVASIVEDIPGTGYPWRR
jgi:hypothetical protein